MAVFTVTGEKKMGIIGLIFALVINIIGGVAMIGAFKHSTVPPQSEERVIPREEEKQFVPPTAPDEGQQPNETPSAEDR